MPSIGRRLRPARHLLLHPPGSHRGPHRDLAPQGGAVARLRRRHPVPREGSAESRLRPQDPRLAARRLFNREWDSNPRPAHARGSLPIPRASTCFPAAHPLGRATGHRHLVRFPLGVLQGQGPPLLLAGLHRPGDAACSPPRVVFLAGARNLETSHRPSLACADQLVRPQRHGRASAFGCPEGPCLGRGSMPPGRRALPPKSLGAAAGQGPRDRCAGLPSMWIPDVSHRRHYRACPDSQGHWRSPRDHRLPRAPRSGTSTPGMNRRSAQRRISPGPTPTAVVCLCLHAPAPADAGRPPRG